MAILLAEQVTVTETRNEIIENEKIEVDTTYCTQSKNVTPGVAVLGDTVSSSRGGLYGPYLGSHTPI